MTKDEIDKQLEKEYEEAMERKKSGKSSRFRRDRFTVKKGDFTIYDKNGNVVVGKEPKKKGTQE